MREIKFRAWDKDYKYMNHKVMVGNVWDEDNYHAHMVWVDAEDVDYECESGWMNFDEHSNIELMQYTGLKDKDGVEIYEGDILKTFSNINKYTDSLAEDIEPKFEYTTIVRDGACFKTTYKKRPSYVLNENSGSMVEHMEVIGNIYENTELLEREVE